MQKLITFFMVIVIFVTGQSCQQKSVDQDVSDLLQKEETRTKVYEAIVSDQEKLQGFMDHMMQSDKAMSMMRDRPRMMHQMMGGQKGMGQMMRKDSAFRHNVMHKMVNIAAKDSAFCRNLNQSMMSNQQVRPMMKHMMQRHGHMNNGGNMRKGRNKENMMD